jgi:RNA polymerase sigma-70 factor (ECF subfamily)
MSDEESSLHTHPSLLVRLRDAQDLAAWQTFVDTYGPALYRYGRHRGLQDADAADVTQEVLAEVARCSRTFEYQPERGRFRDWLGTLARRRVMRFLERQTRGPAATGGEEELAQCVSPQADPEWTDEFNAQVLRVALERIRPHFESATWRAFELVWIEGRPAAQAADELPMPIGSIYVAKSRVLKRLEEEVRALVEDAYELLPPH